MKNINLVLAFFLISIILSCKSDQENNDIYLLFDSKDKLFLKDDDGKYWLFKDQEHFKKWEIAFNYKPGDYQKMDSIPILSLANSHCPPTLFLGEEKNIDLKAFKQLKVCNRTQYLKLIKRSNLRFLIEKKSQDSFLIREIRTTVCE